MNATDAPDGKALDHIGPARGMIRFPTAQSKDGAQRGAVFVRVKPALRYRGCLSTMKMIDGAVTFGALLPDTDCGKT